MDRKKQVSPKANAWLAASALLIGLGNLGFYFTKDSSIICLVCGVGWLLLAVGYGIRWHRGKQGEKE
ncbi:MAG: hypothetical protein E7426_03305 [Ruminococcaceae bacterium]|jgi:hypothetical protein|nr:hypothetical protein [Oscillospiraceae bacterium]